MSSCSGHGDATDGLALDHLLLRAKLVCACRRLHTGRSTINEDAMGYICGTSRNFTCLSLQAHQPQFVDICHFPYSAVSNGFVPIILKGFISAIKPRYPETPRPRSPGWPGFCIGLEAVQKQSIPPIQVGDPHLHSDQCTQATSSSTTLVQAV